ncbi:MAG: hypothetical protein WCD86_20185 [Ktedonobacteraceae bacterium]
MIEKEYLFKLMYAAFLDIRIASYAKDSYTCFVLADVFHNVPLQMNRAETGEMRYAEIVKLLQEKCEERKASSWLDTATTNIANLP